MTRFNIKKAAALLGLCVLSAAPARAIVSYVDTIGDSSKYQIGRQLARTAQVGFETYPLSGDFSGVRPTYIPLDRAHGLYGVNKLGTTGVPCGQLYVAGAPVTGSFGAWVAQPFTPAQSGYITSVDLVAQYGQSAGYAAQLPSAQQYISAYVVSSLSSIPSGAAPVSISVSGAGLGTIVSGTSTTGVPITGGQRYYLLLGIGNPGSWTPSANFYANLNWASATVVPDASNVSAALYDNSNCSGPFVTLTGRVLGIRLRGYTQLPVTKAVGAAKQAANGTVVTLSGVVVTATTGAVGPGFFYVEDPLRSAGIRVVGATTYSVGQTVDVTGTVTTVSGEKAIQLDSLSSSGPNSPLAPIYAETNAPGGSGVGAGVGVNTVGLLVKVSGKVTSSSGTDFTVNDGGVDLKCRAAAGITIPTTGTAAVTGVVSLSGGNAIVLVRSQQDILPIH